MTCNNYKNYDKSSSFVTGCTNRRFEAVKKHNMLLSHIDNVTKEKAQKHTKLSESAAGRLVIQLNKAAFDRLCNLFCNAHMLAKLGRPYTDYVTKEKAQEHTKLSESAAGCSVIQLNKAVFDRLCNLLRNAHMVAKLRGDRTPTM